MINRKKTNFTFENYISMTFLPTIIWDWNGTLLDDIDLCIATINKMLVKRNLQALSKETYRDIFTFPVKSYYEVAGFDFEKEDWNTVAHEFIYAYLSKVKDCTLTPSAKEILSHFKNSGYRQIIISAMEHEELTKSVEHLQIAPYFDYIGGINDHLAGGKAENALNYFRENSISPQQTLWIGDTLHDAEIAAEVGCKCILVSTGHQSTNRLLTSNVSVAQSLQDVPTLIQPWLQKNNL